MTTQIHGHHQPRFDPLREAFAANFESDIEVGASVAVTIEGESVVDLWGGHADAARTAPWQRDTVVNVWSCSKAMTTICALRLVERGLLDVDAPVARYWPEFAKNDKADITVRQVLTHRVGLPVFSDESQARLFADGDWTSRDLESQSPAWEPGSRFQYHAVTFGAMVGEIVRRITGITLGTMLRQEVTGPLGADFHIGLPAEHHPRVADIIRPDNAPQAEMVFINEPGFRSGEMPAGNGHGNARSMARVMAALANGGELHGVRILERQTIETALEEQLYEADAVMGRVSRRGLGFILACPEFAAGHGVPATYYPGATEEFPRIFGHDGLGGFQAYADLDRRISWGYAMNNMGDLGGPSPRVQRLSRALFACLG